MSHPSQPPAAFSPKSGLNPATTSNSPTRRKQSTLKPGVYTLVNAQSGTVIDLSVVDHKTVVGFPRHNGDNQQWRFALLGPGYTIQSNSSGEYLTLKEGITHGAALSMSTFPVAWKVDAYEEAAGELFVQIFWPSENPYVLELAGGDAALFSKIQLASYWQHNERCQLWRVVEVHHNPGAYALDRAQSNTVIRHIESPIPTKYPIEELAQHLHNRVLEREAKTSIQRMQNGLREKKEKSTRTRIKLEKGLDRMYRLAVDEQLEFNYWQALFVALSY
ncbi:hypothetical protein PHLCEN_2v9477 [Hermanssonia centrifuga]|uniref:Ricin B lectin domain-containing protein n=1 Tax=Hermanssonia centrifuga TaxID=98765 RepID=A0A2R6NQN4_9APHY|nr:hypothetical protein PHLCEN_2v9477 [Hermanssonia centrifuga]